MHKTWPASAEVMQVIKTTRPVGKGTEDNPNRIVTEYWSFDGELLARNEQKGQEINLDFLPH